MLEAITATSPSEKAPKTSERWEAKLDRIPAPLSAALIALLTLAIGWADYSTGWEFSFFIFYAVPIVLAVRRHGNLGGYSAALLASAVWFIAHGWINPYSTTIGYVWAMLSRFFYFVVVVLAVAAVRKRQAADAAHIRTLEEQRQLERDIVSVSEYEQQRIGQDLHDGLCQQLAAIGCAARVLADDLGSRGQSEAKDATMIETSLRDAVREARDLARGIFPVHADQSGLSAALGDLAERVGRLTGTEIRFEENNDVSVSSPDVSMNLYRIVQEAVANAVRHSGASQIVVSLNGDEDRIELRIADNGRGIRKSSQNRSDGMGLRTMRYRALSLGADLDFSKAPGGGTAVTCRLNLNRTKA